jgi:hypothetical protein
VNGNVGSRLLWLCYFVPLLESEPKWSGSFHRPWDQVSCFENASLSTALTLHHVKDTLVLSWLTFSADGAICEPNFMVAMARATSGAIARTVVLSTQYPLCEVFEDKRMARRAF